jgi:hypothetical protein
MAKTVIGLIDNLAEAQAAVRDLVASGIAQEDIGFMADQRHELPPTAQLNESEGALAGAGIVITVAADQAAQADLAVALLQRHGAVDIEQRAAEWKKQGWKGRFEAPAESKAAKRARGKPRKAA